MPKRQIDEIEKEFAQNEKKTVNDRAKKILFQNQDDIKEFISKMLLSDCMNERKYQKEIKSLQKATNDFIEEKFHAQDLENMAKYDKKEKEKNKLLKKKKDEQIKIINVEELLKEILEKNDQQYCFIFSFLLYNYEKWFSIRKGPDLKNKNENDIQLNN